jgi:kumamolisin
LPRNESGLSQFVNEVSDPSSRQYGRFLSMEQIGKRFGASHSQIETVLKALSSAGIKGEVNQSRSIIDALVTVAQASKFFGVKFELRKLSNGTKFLTPDSTATLPSDIAGIVEGFSGLIEVYQPSIPEPVPTGAVSSCAQAIAGANINVPIATLNYYGISTFENDQIQGQGMTMAIIETQRSSQASLNEFTNCYGSPPLTPTFVNTSPVGLDQAGLESALDLGVISSVVPQLKRLDVIQVNGYYDPLLAFATALNPADTGGSLPDVISTSVGYCEEDLDPATIPLSEYQLQTAAAAGVTVVASAGDDGSSSCYPQSDGVAVEYPASSPYVTGVGGATLQFQGTKVVGQVVWNHSGAAGGGAPSSVFPEPAFQKEAGIKATHRLVPDVALEADPSTAPYTPICTGSSCVWAQLGGTSAAAPLFGAELVLLKQAIRAKGKPNIGWLNPLLYRDSLNAQWRHRVVYDITQGNNELISHACCQAKPGYDETSGLGGINLYALGEELRVVPPASQVPTPTTTSPPTVTEINPSTGPVGGETSVTISGSNLSGATVYFGNVPGTITASSPDQVTVTSPKAQPGTNSVEVIVRGEYGASAPGPAVEFTYT